jgi:hypothetical protein
LPHEREATHQAAPAEFRGLVAWPRVVVKSPYWMPSQGPFQRAEGISGRPLVDYLLSITAIPLWTCILTKNCSVLIFLLSALTWYSTY